MRNPTKRHGSLLALDRLDLEVAAGQVFGFLGPNGPGKSTTIRLLLGLARPTAGRARVLGVDAADVGAAHRLLAYVPADVTLWPQLTGAEILELLAHLGPGTDLAYRAELVRRFALAADEAAGRLTLTYAGPVTRLRAAGAEVLATAGGTVVLALTAATAMWAGSAASGAGLGWAAALAGAVNVLPVAALSLGAAVFALGLLPRAVAALGALPAVGGFLLFTAAELVDVPAWLLWPSPYRHLAPVPATGPDWAGVAGLTAVAVAVGLAGLAGYARRDLRG